MADSPNTRSRLPHWGWFLLATVVVVIAGIGLSIWLPWYREQQVVRAIEGWRGRVKKRSGGPEWLREILGNKRMDDVKVFERVSLVELYGTEFPDSESYDGRNHG